jgi:tetratricopeptide (TPR) repeat protein
MPRDLHDDNATELRRRGIAAVKAGDNAAARDLLAQAIRRNPRDDLAWLWLSGAVETDYDRRRCLERALAINPHSEAARQGLASLLSSPTAVPAKPAATSSARRALDRSSAAPVAQPLLAPATPSTERQAHQPDTLPQPASEPPAFTSAGEHQPLGADSLASLRPEKPRRFNPLVVAVVGMAGVIVILVAFAAMRAFSSAGLALQAAVPTSRAAPAAAFARTARPAPTRLPPTATATAAPSATPTPKPPTPTAEPTATPSEAELLLAQGLAMVERKDYKGAIGVYNRALKLDPSNAAAYVARGDARLKLKDKRGALADYRRAADIYQGANDTERSSEVAAKIKAAQR